MAERIGSSTLADDVDLGDVGQKTRGRGGNGDLGRHGVEVERQVGRGGVAGRVAGDDGKNVAPLGEGHPGQGEGNAGDGRCLVVAGDPGGGIVETAGDGHLRGIQPGPFLQAGDGEVRRHGVGDEVPVEGGAVAGAVGYREGNGVLPLAEGGRFVTDVGVVVAGRGGDVGTVQCQADAGRIDPGAAGLVGKGGGDAGGGGGEQRAVRRLRGGDDGRGDVAVLPQDADAQEGGHLEIAAFEDHLQVVDPGGGDRRLEVVVLLLEVLLPEDLDAVDEDLRRRDAAGLAVAVPHPQQGLVGGLAALEAFGIDRRRPLEPVEVDRPEEWQVGPGQNGSGQEQAQGCQT